MAGKKVVRQIRGAEDNQTADEKKLLRDVRPLWIQILEPLKNKYVALGLMTFYVATMFIMPVLADIVIFIAVIHYFIVMHENKGDRLPLRMPFSSKKADYSDPKPGRKSYFKASGVLFLGNEMNTMQEIWTSIRDSLTHLLLLGTTGSGKTEILLGIAFNGLATCGGINYVDPKAAPKLPVQLYLMCRLCGRDDDFRVLNYQSNPKKRAEEINVQRTSNTNNPFTFGSAESLTQLLVSLIPKSDGDNAIFGQNAISLITALMFGLVEKRDYAGRDLNIRTIREMMDPHEYITLAKDPTISEATRASMQSFLGSVGWSINKGTEDDQTSGQPRSFAEQYSYARGYFNQSMNSLSDSYGHIYDSQYGEVNMKDVVMSRRICVTLLPSLSKAIQERENLGKISLSAVVTACAVGLGDGKVEGTVEDVVESLPTDCKTIFLVITDEYEAIPTPGFGELLTQGRGLGVANCVATQSIDGMREGPDKKGAQQILENTNVKMVAKVQSGEATWDMVKKLSGGDTKVLQSDGFQQTQHGHDGQRRIDYRDQGQAKLAAMERVKLRDLQEQIEGEFHLFFNGRIVRGDSFYTDVPMNSHRQLRVAHMLKVVPPNKKKFEFLLALQKSLSEAIANQENLKLPDKGDVEIHKYVSDKLTHETAIAALLGYGEKEPTFDDEEKLLGDEGKADDLVYEEVQGGAYENNADALYKGNINEPGFEEQMKQHFDWSEEEYKRDVEEIERGLGASQEDADQTAQNIATHKKECDLYAPNPPVPTKDLGDGVQQDLAKLIEDAF